MRSWPLMILVLLCIIAALVVRLTTGVPVSADSQSAQAYLPFVARSARLAPTPSRYSIAIPDHGAYIGAWIGDLPAEYAEKRTMIEAFEPMTGRRLAIVNVFWSMTVDGGDYTDFKWLNLPKHFADGRLVMVSWKSVDWDSSAATESPIRYQQIINGELDQIIRAAARDVAEFGQPVFLRWAWEMDHCWWPENGPNAFGPDGTQPWDEADDLYGYFGDPAKADGPERFVAAWNHIRSLFGEEGADNAVWVWSPNWVPDPREPDTEWNSIDNYYPGDRQVDWIGTTASNFGYDWIDWLSFEQMFDQQVFPPSIADFHELHPDKPVMIAELACAERGGSKPDWIESTYQVIRQDYPYVKAVLWFSESKEREWQVDSSPESLEAYRNAIANPYFADQVVLQSTSTVMPPTPKIVASGPTHVDVGDRPCVSLEVTNLQAGDSVHWDLYRYHDEDGDGDATNDTDATGETVEAFLDGHGHVGGYFVVHATVTHGDGSEDVLSQSVERIPSRARVLEVMGDGALTGELVTDLWAHEITARVHRFSQFVGKAPSVAFGYQGWGVDLQSRHYMEMIRNGALPFLIWDALVWDRDPQSIEWVDLQAIADGDYDSFIGTNMAILEWLEYPIFLSFHHEFDGPWVPNAFGQPEVFKQAYERIVSLAPDNVIFVFQPNDQSWDPEHDVDDYFPGGMQVYAPSVYNWGSVVPESGWRDPMEMLSGVAADHQRIAPGIAFGLSEFGCTDAGPGSKLDWIRAFPAAAKHHQVSLINLFDIDGWSLTTPPEFADAYREAIGEDAYFLAQLLYPKQAPVGG